MKMIVKNVKRVELNTKIANGLCITQMLDDLILCKSLWCNKTCHRKSDEHFKKRFANNIKFLTMISIKLFYCCGKVFTVMMSCSKFI